LVAAYFATKPRLNDHGELLPIEKDAAVYIAHFCDYLDPVEDPFRYEAHGFFFPPHLVPRIIGQGGLFSIQPEPASPFQKGFEHGEAHTITKLEFSASVAQELQTHLFRLGIRQEMLFPDPDGIAMGIRIQAQMAEFHGCQIH